MELKNIKYYKDMSRETPSFSAELWENGTHIANVLNTGNGGANDFHPVNGHTYKDVRKYDNINTEAEIFEIVLNN